MSMTLFGVAMVLVGGLAVAGSILRDLPFFRVVQGWLGVAACLIGMGYFASFALGSGQKITPSVMELIRTLGGSLVLILTGFMLGFSYIPRLLSSDPELVERLEELYEQLVMIKLPLGIICSLLGIWIVVSST